MAATRVEERVQPEQRSLVVVLGGERVSISWYVPGTNAAELRETLSLRLGVPHSGFVLEDTAGVVTLSAGLPSGLELQARLVQTSASRAASRAIYDAPAADGSNAAGATAAGATAAANASGHQRRSGRRSGSLSLFAEPLLVEGSGVSPANDGGYIHDDHATVAIVRQEVDSMIRLNRGKSLSLSHFLPFVTRSSFLHITERVSLTLPFSPMRHTPILHIYLSLTDISLLLQSPRSSPTSVPTSRGCVPCAPCSRSPCRRSRSRPKSKAHSGGSGGARDS